MIREHFLENDSSHEMSLTFYQDKLLLRCTISFNNLEGAIDEVPERKNMAEQWRIFS